jgi:membrane carboxypeptidase/penicillin-binding protein
MQYETGVTDDGKVAWSLKRHKRRWGAITAGFLCAGLILYYTVEVVIARVRTPQIVRGILQSDAIELQLSDLSARQIEILLKVEDPNFYYHRGVDLRTPGAGLTTITQGLVKKLYFHEFRLGIRKIKQTLLARCALDPLVSKDEQLLMLINTHDFCNDARGLGNAARYYYKKELHALNEQEYIGLVAMFVGCGTFNPIRNPDGHRERVARIQHMLSGEYIPKNMADVYYGDDRNAFRMNYK